MPLSINSVITLANGVRMPLLGFGTYKVTGDETVEASVLAALEAGYRSIDTASMYENEVAIGRALRESGVPRDELFIATKCWNDEQGYAQGLAAFERSRERLGLEYLDLYLVHWPFAAHYADTWRAFEELYAGGLVRAIGVCNFLPVHLEALRAVATVMPMVDQVEFHPRLQQPELVAYCRTAGIALEAWAPLMRGGVAEIAEIAVIARRHGVTPAQVAIRWLLQRDIITIPKSVHVDRIRENADVFAFELTAEECATLDALDTGERVGRHPDSWDLT
ncbi:MAG: aldo/keto reductase [Coriobacteriia bacterium]|nr:aldo/keto reductase [Coriobacteriia bacterium]